MYKIDRRGKGGGGGLKNRKIGNNLNIYKELPYLCCSLCFAYIKGVLQFLGEM